MLPVKKGLTYLKITRCSKLLSRSIHYYYYYYCDTIIPTFLRLWGLFHSPIEPSFADQPRIKNSSDVDTALSLTTVRHVGYMQHPRHCHSRKNLKRETRNGKISFHPRAHSQLLHESVTYTVECNPVTTAAAEIEQLETVEENPDDCRSWDKLIYQANIVSTKFLKNFINIWSLQNYNCKRQHQNKIFCEKQLCFIILGTEFRTEYRKARKSEHFLRFLYHVLFTLCGMISPV
jgi:hypothetical protein